MTENYNGEIEIREKLSMHKRHNFLFCKLFKFIISKGKNHPPKKSQNQQKLRTKTSPPKTAKSANFLKKPSSHANLLMSLVQLVDDCHTD
jgi:hypothetical protein